MNPIELNKIRDRQMKKKTRYKLTHMLKTIIPAHEKYLNSLRS